MSNRLIEINRCVDCPHHAHYIWHCTKMNKDTSCESGWPIPEWCPLPFADLLQSPTPDEKNEK